MSFNLDKIRSEFPCLHTKVHGKHLTYLDNGATTLKPISVIEAITHYYTSLSSNVHRGVHTLSQESTIAYERTRKLVQNFINAKSDKEIIYTSGTTAGINLVSYSLGESFKPGDEIIVTGMEHHSDIVPWQLLCERKKCILKVVPVNDLGELNLEEFKNLLNEKTKLVASVHISNTLGTINPIKKMVQMTRESSSAVFLVDAAQSVSHFKIDVQELDVDFLVFSAHKLFGPTGFGILYGKEALLESMPPFLGGGDMIERVSFSGTTYNGLPNKFEAGTPHIAGSIGLGAAIDYIESIGLDLIADYEHELFLYADKKLKEIPQVRIIGDAKNKIPIFSFIIEGIHSQDLGMILDQSAIAVRTGHHCTMPLLESFRVDSTTRASFSFYNTKKETDTLVEGIQSALRVFS